MLATKKECVLLVKIPNRIICGGILFPGQRVISAETCLPNNYTNIKVQLRGWSELMTIKEVYRKDSAALIIVSHFKHHYLITLLILKNYKIF